MMNLPTFLLDTTLLPPNGGEAVVATAETAEKTGGFMGGNPVTLIIVYCVIIFAAMYFFSIRPNRKREQKLAEMRNAITVGDTVLLSNGFFGKVADITAECFIIEFGTNKGVKIPVLKQEVFVKREPNLSNKELEQPKEEPKKSGGFLGLGKKKDTEESQ